MPACEPHTVGIVDYGTGNIASLEQAFTVLGVRIELISTPSQLSAIDALVLPGVGHFGPSSEQLRHNGLQLALIEAIRGGLPTLGICLGFQLLTRCSAEAPEAPGLGLLPLHTERLQPRDTRLHKVPHLGWNTLHCEADPPALLAGIAPSDRLFYFANAYAVAPCPSFTAPQAFYRHESEWLATVQHGNIHGVQFHPEKSRRQGLQLLRNFLEC